MHGPSMQTRSITQLLLMYSLYHVHNRTNNCNVPSAPKQRYDDKSPKSDKLYKQPNLKENRPTFSSSWSEEKYHHFILFKKQHGKELILTRGQLSIPHWKERPPLPWWKVCAVVYVREQAASLKQCDQKEDICFTGKIK